MSLELSEQEIIRRETLNKIREKGIEPYPAALFPVDTLSKEVQENYEEGKRVVIAGRLMTKNIMGKASFSSIQDSAGRVQAYFNRDVMCPDEDKSLYNDVYKKMLDIGDFIGIEGTLFTTQVGEKSINVEKMTLLSKSLKPLPMPKTDSEGKVHDAFTNPELRYRQRYVDLVVNPQVKEVFV
ncbi:MAG: OB-fold nucleic acid binding domain-containing protein, partial [Flavobacteriales bacterium]